ncbi:MAG: hypothetical protein AAGF11_10875 [Myxococcota bacterium]
MAPLPRPLAVVAVVVAALFVANGVFMLVRPEAWYYAIDGVPDTGPFNQHFIRDIGFVYVVTGLGVAAGVTLPTGRVVLWLGAGAWHISHAAFHVWEVIVGICGPEALARDFAAVTLPSVVTLGLGLYAWRVARARPSTTTAGAV